ncbi:MAG: uroporphyrinogen-III synthase, partial [Paracoccaceae bacterium]
MGQPIQLCEPALPTSSAIVVVTRPAAAEARFADMLGSAMKVVISPVIRIEPVAFQIDLAGVGALVLTSRNGALALRGLPGLRGKPAFAVGTATAQSAKELGLAVVSAPGDAHGLVATIVAARPDGRLLFVRGVHSRGDIENRL